MEIHDEFRDGQENRGVLGMPLRSALQDLLCLLPPIGEDENFRLQEKRAGHVRLLRERLLDELERVLYLVGIQSRGSLFAQFVRIRHPASRPILGRRVPGIQQRLTLSEPALMVARPCAPSLPDALVYRL